MKKSLLIHNPKCSKCIGAKEILESLDIEFDVISYLSGGLTEELLKSLPHLTGNKFSEMVRTKEALFAELGLEGKTFSDEEWIRILLKHPILLERPIFIHNGRAVIARPSELVKS